MNDILSGGTLKPYFQRFVLRGSGDAKKIFLVPTCTLSPTREWRKRHIVKRSQPDIFHLAHTKTFDHL